MNGFYVHAVVRADACPPVLPPLLENTPPRLVMQRDIAAVATCVPLALFTGKQAEDPDWIALCARAHHAAAALMPRPSLPLAFGTVFSSDAAIASWLASRHDGLAAGLDQVEDAAEWTLSIGQTDPDAPSPPDDTERPGLAFLRARAAARVARDHRRARRDQAFQEAGSLLADHARLVRGAAPRWTALVAQDRHANLETSLSALAERVRPDGLILTLSGPWPAYITAREAAHGEA